MSDFEPSPRMGSAAEFNGEYFDSETEAAWASYFTAVGIEYVREPESFRLGRVGGYSEVYTPDFWLPTLDAFAEVKNGNITEDAVSKIQRLAYRTGNMTMLLDSKPRNAAIYFFTPDGSKPHNYMYKPNGQYKDEHRNGAAAWAPRHTWQQPPGFYRPFALKIAEACRAAEHGWTTDVDPEIEAAALLRRAKLRKSAKDVRLPAYPQPK